jgi:hypothetical protein
VGRGLSSCLSFEKLVGWRKDCICEFMSWSLVGLDWFGSWVARLVFSQ